MRNTTIRVLDWAGCTALAVAALALGLQLAQFAPAAPALLLGLFATAFRTAIALFLIARLLELGRFRNWDSRRTRSPAPPTLPRHGEA